jgi:RNA polymerase sigma-70 factor (ECF subfamily)
MVNSTGFPMDYSKLDDVTLLQLMAQDRTEALGELYDRYNRLVFSLALAVVGDDATADEITLDVFTRLWQRSATYRVEKAKVTTWMTAITRHLAIDELRRRKARPEATSATWPEPAAPAQAGGRHVEESVELALQRQRVRAAVAQLPPEQRQALALAYFRGLTHPQIAEALQQPLGTVKTRIRLAMQKLRYLLREELPPDKQSNRPTDAYHTDTAHEEK